MKEHCQRNKTEINYGSLRNTIVGYLFAHDEDINETFTFSLVTGQGDDDNAEFRI